MTNFAKTDVSVHALASKELGKETSSDEIIYIKFEDALKE